ncbi:hypothetical protein [Staphylococcus succinus]|uniref:hypothetical protein n=1 Tax=Staphylococcus succinus TaxID=61015 RepID=UPI0012EC662A|nr:hypothetical protein [Staphylococcus succinus]
MSDDNKQNNNNSHYIKKQGVTRSNPLNKGVEKPAPSEELIKILKEESKKD